METNQPKWKYATYVGDIDPIAYGGGIVYQDETGVYDPEMIWFEPALDKECQKDSDNCIVTMYRMILEHDITREWWYNRLEEVARFCGCSVSFLLNGVDTDIHMKALLYESLIRYFGEYEFDQYPNSITNKEAYTKFKDEFKLMRQ